MSFPEDEAERVLYPIWGQTEKLASLSRKAQEPRKELLLRLLKAAGEYDDTDLLYKSVLN